MGGSGSLLQGQSRSGLCLRLPRTLPLPGFPSLLCPGPRSLGTGLQTHALLSSPIPA